jgi:hypothetical protein
MNLCFIFDILRGVLFVTDCVEVIKPEFCQKNSLEDFGDFIIRGELTRTVKCKEQNIIHELACPLYCYLIVGN